MDAEDTTTNPSPAELPDIFTYFDYRSWMGDAQKAIKLHRKVFTFEYIARKVGLRSKSHITQIIQGTKGIPVRLIDKFAATFELDVNEARFLEALVGFNHSRTHHDKKVFLDRMVALQGKVNKRIVAEQYEFCRHWYYPVIRELVRVVKVSDNMGELARMVRPRITTREARDAVQALEAMRLIQRDAKGFLQQTDSVITFGDGWRSVAVREFQHQALDLAKNALEEVLPESREISTVTMSITKARFRQIKDRLQEFRQEVLGMVRTDDDPEQVFQMSLSLFPVSIPQEDGHAESMQT